MVFHPAPDLKNLGWLHSERGMATCNKLKKRGSKGRPLGRCAGLG